MTKQDMEAGDRIKATWAYNKDQEITSFQYSSEDVGSLIAIIQYLEDELELLNSIEDGSSE